MQSFVKQFIKQHDLLQPNTTIIVGVSGGPDSMALLHYLHSIRKEWNLKLIACSVDHMLRGDASQGDMKYVESYCKEMDILFYGKRMDVLAYKNAHHLSVEVAARECRYHVFKEVMKNHQANCLALAHHGDDQVETMLMRQVRGSFGVSLAGIPVKRPFATGHIIRPFLCVTKRHLEQYCKENGISPRYDNSNMSSDYVRNRFRHVILPFLKKENPKVHVRYQYMSERMTEDQRYLDQLAKEHVDRVILNESEQGLRIDIGSFLKIPLPLQRRVIHLILNYLYSNKGLSSLHHSIHIEALLQLLQTDHPSSEEHLPNGLVVKRSYNTCVFTFNIESDSINAYQSILSIPGTTKCPTGSFTVELADVYHSTSNTSNTFYLRMADISEPLKVRTRSQGDRISPKGMSGTQKLKSIFINEKIERKEREIWPILVDANESVLWLPLLRQRHYKPRGQEKSAFIKITFLPTVKLGRKTE
ncbi:tRNA lysidine(34) synthetase TilS [Terrilactibacillus laevilacticus]|uniref:tRNA(Ile)-lysidine synthase n=1 Tax=Terrilactibacillus laevilacticus TaxID=1380157 RepID=A0ABW5PRF7_9BACI|nr:tRNA lysidine(34) synthetase TilS [Terrilactibacillus laevilacticus]